jgi:Fe-S-cluster-containing hydrogenase component 2
MAAKVNEEKCVGCGSCESACPMGANKSQSRQGESKRRLH